MKNFFKIVLPAFALMLAITASLAFTSNASESDEVDVTVSIWNDQVTPQVCINKTVPESLILNCEITNFGAICTATIQGQNQNPKDLYEAGSTCQSSKVLRKP